MKRTNLSTLILACCMTLAALSPQVTLAQGRRPSDVVLLADQEGQVTRVIDGETIEVSIHGTPTRVRYLGLDAPNAAECYAAQAARANADLVQGQHVFLERDVTDADSNGNALRYVYLGDGRMANEELLKGGYARAQTSLPDTLHQSDLNRLEQTARAARLGGWRACGWTSPVARAPGACQAVAAESLIARAAAVPEVSLLSNGDCVVIFKAANPEGPAWQGKYLYHPAGSQVRMTDMYARWKDGFVMITHDADGQWLASMVRDTYKPARRRGDRPGEDPNPGASRVTAKPLERAPADNAIVQLPDTRTWILRDLGNGQYQALVDVFEYQSGDIRVPQYAPSGYLY